MAVPRHDEDLREPLVRRQGSQVSMRVARGSASWLSSHGRGLGHRDALKKDSRGFQQLDEHEFEQDPGVGDGQGSLACCSSWGCKKSNTVKVKGPNHCRTTRGFPVGHFLSLADGPEV